MAPVALKFTVLLIFAAASGVLANPSFLRPSIAEEQQWPHANEQQFADEQQFAEEQQIVDQQAYPPWLRADEQQYYAGEQQIVDQQRRPPWLENNVARVMMPRCNSISVFFVRVTVCQQTATQCGSVSVIAPSTDVNVNVCRRG